MKLEQEQTEEAEQNDVNIFHTSLNSSSVSFVASCSNYVCIRLDL
jgi:hypothetical protein